MSRQKMIAGNWKMNKTASEATELIKGIQAQFTSCPVNHPEVLVCPTFTSLTAAVEAAKDSPMEVGAQNIHWAESGAFTGEISGDMLNEIGVTHVIIGHSERRQYFGETNDTVNKRVKAALAHNLKPVICVGETLEQRESNITKKIIEEQVRVGLTDITADQMADIVIAYEPVWAIGTGKTASKEQAQDVHAFIRGLLNNIYAGTAVAENTRILYGGSMKPKNAKELLDQKDIDGGLIGGAALKPVDFAAIIQAAM
ncbi:MAG: triose-phosphate isomerase [Lentisphaeria bacterium]